LEASGETKGANPMTTGSSVEKRDLEALLEISRQMVALKDLDKLLDLVLDRSTELLSAERSSLFVLDHDTGELWTKIAQGLIGRTIRLPVGTGIVGHVARMKRMLNIEDAYLDDRFNPEVDRETGFRTRSILCVPMLNQKNDCIGVIEVLNKKDGHSFNAYDEELLGALALHAALAIENAQLYQEKEEMLRSLVRSLAAAIDARDPVTAGHSERVTGLAMNIARQLDLDDDTQRVVELAANLHDVGKLGVPDAILQKADQLTDDEFAAMKDHARFTKRILDSIDFPRGLRRVPRVASLHHEKMDGTGYPEGLEAGRLDIVSRIIAVADVYDAMVSYDRPYKKAANAEEAVQVLRDGAGTHFDPAIVEAFIEHKLYQLERRRFQRVSADVAIEYWIIPDARIREKVVFAQAIDISVTGLAFESKTSLAPWTFLETIIHTPGQTFDLIARVVRSEAVDDGLYRIAVRFVNLTPDVKQILDQLLRDLL